MGQRSKPANAGMPKVSAKVSGQDAGKKESRSQVNLRLTPDEKAALKARAKRAGLNVTSYLLALGLRRQIAEDGRAASVDFSDHDAPGKTTTHEANLKHLANWSTVLDQQQVDTVALKNLLKLHLEQAATEQGWQRQAIRLGQELVQATKLGASAPVLQVQTDDLCRKLREHLKKRP